MTTIQSPGDVPRRKRAVLYLRVSYAGQVNTDYDPEGISLPAQRAKCEARAAELDADVVDEYVEPGRSAKNTDARPKFRQMMARIKAEQDVDYVIVYARSRLHRNSIDAAITKRDLKAAGVVLISVMDYTEDNAVGDLVATVLDAVNEYQSVASGADISYKMSQKAARGGSIARAPIGYLNVREKFEGREIHTVAPDPERAPLVRMAFELYATGSYSFQGLIETLTDAGLRMRPDKRHPAGTPISMHKIGKLLRDRFYLGYVLLKGQEFPGRHEPLVSQEVFDRVQQVLKEERLSGNRERTHNHYLKGLVWCDRCERRLIIMPGKSKSGVRYFYYICIGRKDHSCDLPYIQVAKVEDAVLANYASITLPEELRAKIVAGMDGALASSADTSGLLRAKIEKQLAKLGAQEDQYLDLVGDADWPREKIAARLRGVRDERARLAQQLDEAKQPKLAAGASALHGLLSLLADPRSLYRSCGTRGRKVLNQTFFTRLYINWREGGPYVASDRLTSTIEPLVEAHRHPGGYENSGDLVSVDNVAAGDLSPSLLLNAALSGMCSTTALLVREGGVEPPRPCGHWNLNPARLPFRHSRATRETIAVERAASQIVSDGYEVRTRGWWPARSAEPRSVDCAWRGRMVANR